MKNISQDISKEDCMLISKKIRDDIYKPAFTSKTTIVLCGADINQKDNIRHQVATALMNKNWFDIIYPEDIFDELLYSLNTTDLLTLEGLLAESVDAIVIIPESPGSFAELGAFANDETLRKKLICIVDKKYKKHKSFINQGPLKLIKKENSFGLIFIDPNDIHKELEKLIRSLRKIKKASPKDESPLSLLQIDNFLLPSIYLLEPVTKTSLTNLVESATEDVKNSVQITTTALTILIKKKLIQLTNHGYKLTSLGLEKFHASQKTKTRIKNQVEKIEIDNIRLEILNLKNRRKRLKYRVSSF